MLIQVTAGNEAIAAVAKDVAHDGDGVLHRAFSAFVADADGRVLLQRRSALKRLWPGFWSNSFCSHPRWGESTRDAALRRAPEELGFRLHAIEHLYDFTYFARYLDVGAEHEVCSVYLARVMERPTVQLVPGEVSDWRWCSLDEIDQQIPSGADAFTPWFLLEWPAVRSAMRRT